MKLNLKARTSGELMIGIILIILFILGIDWVIWKIYQVIDDILLRHQIIDLPDFGFWEFFFLLLGIGIVVNILSRIFRK